MSDTVPDSTDLAPNKMAVELNEKLVRIEIMCVDHYKAIRLFEQVSKACREGELNLKVSTDRTCVRVR